MGNEEWGMGGASGSALELQLPRLDLAWIRSLALRGFGVRLSACSGVPSGVCWCLLVSLVLWMTNSAERNLRA
jgi:hypothetical protein